VREDGIFESLTVVYLLITSILFGLGFFRFWKSPWPMRLSCAGLALLFSFGAGEEISWGDRYFDLVSAVYYFLREGLLTWLWSALGLGQKEK
jgi:hypothetical protein